MNFRSIFSDAKVHYSHPDISGHTETEGYSFSRKGKQATFIFGVTRGSGNVARLISYENFANIPI